MKYITRLLPVILIVAIACEKNPIEDPPEDDTVNCIDSISNYTPQGELISLYQMGEEENSNCEIIAYFSCRSTPINCDKEENCKIIRDSNSRVSEEHTCNNSECEVQTKYYYNSTGQCIKSEYYVFEEISNYWEYSYDSKGRINKKDYYNSKGSLIESRIFGYCD